MRKIINYGSQTILKKDLLAVNKTLTNSFITQGLENFQFEKKLKDYSGAKYCSTVSSGTAALHLIGLALNWKKGDIIITTPITFVATANSIVYSGAKPEFVDINSNTYNIDLNLLERRLKKNSNNNKVKAVICIDYAGNPCDWESLRYLANKYKIMLINDNCHALGSKYNGDSKYAAKFADVVSQSFHALKNITTGEGGAVITNNREIYKKVNLLRNHGLSLQSNKFEYWKSDLLRVGYNYRLTSFQAALGISQLSNLKSFLKLRKKIATVYDNYFKNSEYLTIPPVKKSDEHSYHLYPLLIDFEKINISKDNLFKYLLKKNFRLQVHYKPIHTFEFYKKKYGFKFGDFPNAEKFFKNEVSIPIYPKFKKRDQSIFLKYLSKLIY